jgi:hypothetical protein
MVNNNPYASIPQAPVSSSSQAPAPSLANLPPNILALLQQTAQAQQQAAQPPASTQYGMPPTMPAAPPVSNVPLASTGTPGYQQLMAYLVSYRTYHDSDSLLIYSLSNHSQGNGRNEFGCKINVSFPFYDHYIFFSRYFVSF